MRTIKQRVQISEAEAAYLIDLLRKDMYENLSGKNEERWDMNINIRMKLLKGITRIEDKKQTPE